MSTLTLNEFFRFGQAELEQNRKGNMTDYQKAILRRSGKVAFFIIAFLGVFIACAVYYVNRGKDIALMRTAITFAGFVVVGLFFWGRTIAVASRQKVKSVSGIVTFAYRHRAGNSIVVNGRTFSVGGNRVNELFQENIPYTIYYTGSSSILSVEKYRGLAGQEGSPGKN